MIEFSQLDLNLKYAGKHGLLLLEQFFIQIGNGYWKEHSFIKSHWVPKVFLEAL